MRFRRSASPRSLSVCLIALVVCAGLVLAACSQPSRAGQARLPKLPAPRTGYDVTAYRGLGTWIDIFDKGWSTPAKTVRRMKARGVRTLYIETTNYSHKGGGTFVYPDATAAFIDAAHKYGVRIVGWYLPGLKNVKMDAQRSIAAIRYRTPAGNGFDSFAMDIEAAEVKSLAKRNARLLRLSAQVRAAVGQSYPMGAIIPSPYGIEHAGGYWPNFPYAQLRSFYDVYLPMAYFTWRVKGQDRAHWYIQQCVGILRAKSGSPTFPIHMIGGIADDATVAETKGFVQAVRESGLLGASYYTFPRTSASEWTVLDRVPVNPVESPALPVPIKSSSALALGNISGGDTTHPKEVVYSAGPRKGSGVLSYDAFDAQQGEIAIYVDWRYLGTISPGPTGGWTGMRHRTIPASFLHDSSPNVIQFVAQGTYPSWSAWGVRSVALAH